MNSEAGMPSIEQARGWYDRHDPVHGFDHVLRVARLAEVLGRELGADQEILQAAALLHDASGAQPAEPVGRTTHEQESADFARQVLAAEGWRPERIAAVEHCIRAHRFRSVEAPATLEAEILFDADKLDVVGAFGAARTIGFAVQSGVPIFAEPSARFLETGETEPGEPHSAYHEYLFKLRHVRERLHTEPAKQMAARRYETLCHFFEQLAAEARSEV
jgi:uncharacterized protein